MASPDAEQEDERVPPGGAEFVAGVGDGHGAEQDVLELADHDQRHEQRGEDQRCVRTQNRRSDALGFDHLFERGQFCFPVTAAGRIQAAFEAYRFGSACPAVPTAGSGAERLTASSERCRTG